MSTNVFKAFVSIFTFMLAASVIALAIAGVLWIRKTQRLDTPADKVIKDSLAVYSGQVKINQDSALFHFNQYEKFTKVADSLSRDSMAMDRRRAEYSAELRAKIREQLQDSAIR